MSATATAERALRYISTVGMSRDEWLHFRRNGIGSSDAGAILGLSEYRTPLDVYRDKIGEAEERQQTERMEFGLKLEQVVADTYEERTGRRVVRDNKIRIHKSLPFMMANIDRLILSKHSPYIVDDLTLETGILEIKTASSYAFKSWETQVPLEYFAQIQHQFAVTGLQWGAFAVLVDGAEFHVVEVFRDDNFIAMLEGKLSEFWTMVENRTPPDPVVKDLEISLTNPEAKVEADVEVLDLLTRLSIMSENVKTLQDQKKAIEDKIKLFIGTNEVLTFGGKVVASWKRSKDSLALDVDRLKEENPDIYSRYQITKSGSRRFLVNHKNITEATA